MTKTVEQLEAELDRLLSQVEVLSSPVPRGRKRRAPAAGTVEPDAGGLHGVGVPQMTQCEQLYAASDAAKAKGDMRLCQKLFIEAIHCDPSKVMK